MICVLYSTSARSARQALEHPSQIHELLDSTIRQDEMAWLEKSWHGLHFVLTGTADEGEPPLNFIVAGGEPIGEDYFGFGPVRVILPDQVVLLDSALAAMTNQDILYRFDPTRMTAEQVYPFIWDEPLEILLVEYGSYLDKVRAFVAKAARNNKAILVALS